MSAASIAQQALSLAEQHLGKGVMQSSAQLCADDSRALIAKGRHKHAALRALRSLEYSVGGFHPDCAKAEALIAQVA